MKSLMKFTYLCVCIFVISCQQKQEGLVTTSTIDLSFHIATERYVQSPEPSDSLCIWDIKRAEHDLNTYRKIYIHNFGRGRKDVEYKEELDSLLKTNGFQIKNEHLAHHFEKNYTYQCYDEYIRWKMKQKYGDSVFLKLERQAEEIFQLKSLLPDK